MLRTLFIALALSAAILAQDVTPSMPHRIEDATQMPEDTTGGKNEYRKVIKGDLEEDLKNFRTYIEKAQQEEPLSYWHDIPLFFQEQEKIYNMVVEIPRGEALKTLLNLSQPLNPITVAFGTDGHPLEENVDYIHNYGKIPQTWVSGEKDQHSELLGSETPLDVVEISDKTHEIGDVIPVKMLGLLGVKDGNKVEYKLVALDTRSSFADQINHIDDVETHFPDLLAATRGYFRFYKFPEQVNDILFAGRYRDAGFAHTIITEKHEQWKKLIQNQDPPRGINTQSRAEDAAFKANDEEWKNIIQRE